MSRLKPSTKRKVTELVTLMSEFIEAVHAKNDEGAQDPFRRAQRTAAQLEDKLIEVLEDR